MLFQPGVGMVTHELSPRSPPQSPLQPGIPPAPCPPHFLRLHRNAHFHSFCSVAGRGYTCRGNSPFGHQLTHRTLRKAPHAPSHPEAGLSLRQEEEGGLSEWKHGGHCESPLSTVSPLENRARPGLSSAPAATRAGEPGASSRGCTSPLGSFHRKMHQDQQSVRLSLQLSLYR